MHEKRIRGPFCTLIIIVWKFYFKILTRSRRKRKSSSMTRIISRLLIARGIRGPFCVHRVIIVWKVFVIEYVSVFLDFLNSFQKSFKSMKTRIISRLLIAREKDTWTILCTLMIVFWKVFVIEYVFVFLDFLNSFQKSFKSMKSRIN